MSETAKKTWLKDSSGDKLIPFTTEEMVLDAEGNQASLNYMKTGDVVANPTLAGTESALSGLEIGGTKYKIPESGSEDFIAEATFDNEMSSITLIDTDFNTMYEAETSGKNVILSVLFPPANIYIKHKCVDVGTDGVGRWITFNFLGLFPIAVVSTNIDIVFFEMDGEVESLVKTTLIDNKMDKVNPTGSGTFNFDGDAVFTGDVEDGDGNKLSTVASTVASNYADSVHVSTYEQGLTDQEKANARTNIEAVSITSPSTNGKFSHNRNSSNPLGNNSVVLSTATDSFATQSEAIAIGSSNQIQTEGVIAIGHQNYISGSSKWNTYIGRQLKDPGGGPWNALVLGTYNEIGLGESAQFIIGSGKDADNRMNAMSIYTDGCVSIGRYPAVHTLNDNSKIFVIGNGVNKLTRRNAMEIDSTNKTTFNGLVVAPNIPAYPSTDGVYKLTCTVVDGIPEWTWEAE